MPQPLQPVDGFPEWIVYDPSTGYFYDTRDFQAEPMTYMEALRFTNNELHPQDRAENTPLGGATASFGIPRGPAPYGPNRWGTSIGTAAPYERRPIGTLAPYPPQLIKMPPGAQSGPAPYGPNRWGTTSGGGEVIGAPRARGEYNERIHPESTITWGDWDRMLNNARAYGLTYDQTREGYSPKTSSERNAYGQPIGTLAPVLNAMGHNRPANIGGGEATKWPKIKWHYKGEKKKKGKGSGNIGTTSAAVGGIAGMNV